MTRRDLSGDDAALVRSTTRRIALQSAAMVALVVVVLSGLAVVIALRQQHNQTNSLLTQAAASADDVADPPAGTWLTIRSAGVTTTTPGAPHALPDLRSLAAVTATGRTDSRDLHAGGREFRVRTIARGAKVIQASLDLSAQHAERKHLLMALLGVGAGGLVLAGVSGLAMGRRAVRPLAQALGLQRDFVADASHELRTPLTLLSTRAQLLARALDSADVEPSIRVDSQGVVRDTSRLVSVVDDLLIAAEGMGDPGQTAVDLGLIAHELADSALAHAADRRIALSASTPQQPLLVRGNPVALRRALTALVDNALAHTPDGGAVTLVAAQDRDGCTIDVVDTGPGLDPVATDRIFERFHSGAQRAGRRSYGLGLSLASGVAARHEGSLSVLASGPAGTTFRLWLPRATADSA